MGNGRSLFGEPHRCNRCGKREPGDAKWRIKYENTDIDERAEQYMFAHMNKQKTFIADDQGVVRGMSALTGPLDFATAKAEEVEHIVGKMNVSWSVGISVNMNQYLCEQCHDVVKARLDELPEEWGFEAHYDPRGHEFLVLP